MHAIVVHIADHAHDLTPGASVAFADSLAERTSRLVPQLAGQVLGNHGDGLALLEIGPGKISARYQLCANRWEESRRDVSEPAHRWRPTQVGGGYIFASDAGTA